MHFKELQTDRERFSPGERRKEMKNSIKNLMLKAVELVDKLDYIEDIEDIQYSVRPYNHKGYSNHILILRFKEHESGERPSEMYLFNIDKQAWELRK